MRNVNSKKNYTYELKWNFTEVPELRKRPPYKAGLIKVGIRKRLTADIRLLLLVVAFVLANANVRDAKSQMADGKRKMC